MAANLKLLRQALKEVENEVIQATSKYGPFNSTHEGFGVLKEEVDELWEEVKANAGVIRLREEAVQVAAMGIRFMMDCAEENPSLSRQQALMALASGKAVTDRLALYELIDGKIIVTNYRNFQAYYPETFFNSEGPFLIDKNPDYSTYLSPNLWKSIQESQSKNP